MSTWARSKTSTSKPPCSRVRSATSDQLIADLTAVAGPEFTRRLHSHGLSRNARQVWSHPVGGELCFDRETLELPAADAQQLVVLLPADEATQAAMNRLRRGGGLALVR
jgi:transcription regulator MmyB-like protein